MARSVAGNRIVIAVEVNAPGCELPANEVTALGCIATELLMNAVKHAFDTVPGDEEDIIPLPENQGKPRRAIGGVNYP